MILISPIIFTSNRRRFRLSAAACREIRARNQRTIPPLYMELIISFPDVRCCFFSPDDISSPIIRESVVETVTDIVIVRGYVAATLRFFLCRLYGQRNKIKTTTGALTFMLLRRLSVANSRSEKSIENLIIERKSQFAIIDRSVSLSFRRGVFSREIRTFLNGGSPPILITFQFRGRVRSDSGPSSALAGPYMHCPSSDNIYEERRERRLRLQMDGRCKVRAQP